MVETPSAVNQMPTTGHADRKKWRLLELLKKYWKMSRPKWPWLQQCYKSLLLDRTCNHGSGTQFQWFHEPVKEVTSEPCVPRTVNHRRHQLPTCGRGASGMLCSALEDKHIVEDMRDQRRPSEKEP